METKFKLYRKLAHKTQTDMAKELHVARQTYINYEKNIYEPSLSSLVKMSKILNVSIDALLGNDSPIVQDVSSCNQLIKDVEELVKKYK